MSGPTYLIVLQGISIVLYLSAQQIPFPCLLYPLPPPHLPRHTYRVKSPGPAMSDHIYPKPGYN